MQKLIECVPNFSEGRDLDVIRQITAAIESVEGVSLLDVDPGASTNRTVVTFVGTPEAVVEAAFRGIQKAAELIDMRKHKGAHPRMGATDVCPFIPVSNVSWEEAIACANELGKRVGEELKIPVYLYEKAAKDPSRSNLSIIRAGEYEGFAEKMKEAGLEAGFRPGRLQREIGRHRDWRAGISGRLQCKSEHEGSAPGELGRFRCERKWPGQNGGWHAFRKTGARCQGRTGAHPRNVEARQSDRLVCGGIRHGAGLDEPDEHRRNAVACGF